MTDVPPPDKPTDLPPPAPLPPVTDSPLGVLADATPAAGTRAAKPVAKKVVKKVVKKAVKRAPGGTASGAPQAKAPSAGPRPPSAPRSRPTRAVDPVDALLDDRQAPPAARTLGAQAQASMKGIIVLGVAAAVGFVLLSAGYQRDGTLILGKPVGTMDSTTTTASHFSTTTSVPLTTMTTAPLKKPGELTIQVANAGKIPGTPAGDNTRKLNAAGYKTKGPMDDLKGVPATVIFYKDNLKGEAEAVAKVLGFEPTVVTPMPDPPPTFAQGASIVVELGPDYKPS